MLQEKPDLALLLSYLTSIEDETYIVGGAVRNHLLGLEYSDIDIVTKMKPDRIVEAFKDLPMDIKGLPFGNVKVQYNDQWISLTTFRRDSYKENNRYPVKVEFVDTLAEDLLRRDFVVNTICYHINRGIVDLLDGLRDLDCYLLRTVKDANMSFEEDPLRMFRALRFCCEYDFDLSHEVVLAIRNHYRLIKILSMSLSNEEKRRMKAGAYYAKKKRQYPNLFRIMFM